MMVFFVSIDDYLAAVYDVEPLWQAVQTAAEVLTIEVVHLEPARLTLLLGKRNACGFAGEGYLGSCRGRYSIIGAQSLEVVGLPVGTCGIIEIAVRTKVTFRLVEGECGWTIGCHEAVLLVG